MLINLKRSSQKLAAATLLVGAATAAVPALTAFTPLPAATSGGHIAALGCTRADICTTATTDGVIEPYADTKTAATGVMTSPLGQQTTVMHAAAAPAYWCTDVCQHN